MGKRMSIKNTRTCINAILDGSIKSATFTEDPVFGFSVPQALHGVEGGVLDPRSAWADKKAYDAQRLKLGGMFQKNYTKYVHPGVTDYSKHGPKV